MCSHKCVVIPPGTPFISVDMTSLPHSPLESEDTPPQIPPQQFLPDDTQLSPKLLESGEPYQNERDALPPHPPKANQEDIAPPPRPPKTNQEDAAPPPRPPKTNQEDAVPPPRPPKTNLRITDKLSDKRQRLLVCREELLIKFDIGLEK